MTNYETFALTIGYIAFILSILAVVGLAVYYLIKLSDWVLSKVRSISAKRVLSKVFKKGNK
jgi:hypothetical protein